MTYRERMMIDDPKKIGARWIGGVCGCPHYYYPGTNKPSWCGKNSSGECLETKCRRCWDREMPENHESPYEYWMCVLREREFFQKYTFIVLGKVGPTGKTWITGKLREYGFKTAYEITESICDFVSYTDNQNHFVINPQNMTVTIILNETLELFKKEEPVRKMTVSEVEKLVGSKVEIVAED